MPQQAMYPKIELHVHLDSAVRPALLLRLARRNGYVLPFSTVEEFAENFRVAPSRQEAAEYFESLV